LRDLIKQHAGEFDWWDFKTEWIADNKLAKQMLGMANMGGGVVVFGVLEHDDGTTDPIGLEKMKDKADVQKGVEKYVPESLTYEVMNFSYSESEYGPLVGKKFQVLFVDSNAKDLPYTCTRSGDNLIEGVIYVRRGTSAEPATYDEVQDLIGSRVDTGFSGTAASQLHDSLSQLKVLFDYDVPRWLPQLSLAFLLGNVSEESFEDFVRRMIVKKKKLIEKELGVVTKAKTSAIVAQPAAHPELTSLFANPPVAPPGHGS
jgi:hypothetical protein